MDANKINSIYEKVKKVITANVVIAFLTICVFDYQW